jgi:hypothetical protein
MENHQGHTLQLTSKLIYFIGFNHQKKDFSMNQPRKTLACIEYTPYYHLISRCVQRSYLCAVDHTRGKSYEHRRQWIKDRLRILASLFALDLCVYSVMPNPIHIVAKVCRGQSTLWKTEEILQRWTSLSSRGPLLVQKWLRSEPMINVEQKLYGVCCS